MTLLPWTYFAPCIYLVRSQVKSRLMIYWRIFLGISVSEVITPSLTTHVLLKAFGSLLPHQTLYLTEDFLKQTHNPYNNSEVAYGYRVEHCWNGRSGLPNYVTRLKYNTMYLDEIKNSIKSLITNGLLSLLFFISGICLIRTTKSEM